jgi:sec-independent protein translocase protein TatB
MLPGVGGTELVVIAIVALIVVGPKDLPILMRKIGQFMNKIRGMASEFRASFDELARQSELDELRKEVEALRRGTVEPLKADMDATGREIESSLYPPYEPTVSSEVKSPDWADSIVDPVFETPEKPKRVRKKAVAKPVEAVEAAKPAPKPRTRKAKA